MATSVDDVTEAMKDVVDPEHQFSGVEGLGEIIIGAGFETGDAAVGFRAGGQQNDWRFNILLTGFSNQRQTIQLW